MSKPKHPSIVRVVAAGVALSLGSAGCSGAHEPRTSNPPPPDPQPTANPPPPEPVPQEQSALPAWDDIESGHPQGATNPPIPVLEVTADGERCFKQWQSPMIPDGELRELGGRVLDDAAAARGVEVQCPAERRDALLERHAAREAGEGDASP